MSESFKEGDTLSHLNCLWIKERVFKSAVTEHIFKKIKRAIKPM